jgi:hypothetical protein
MTTTIQRHLRFCVGLLIISLLGAGTVTSAQAAPRTAGTTYYVSPGGSDANSGVSSRAALQTIQSAVDRAQPGDTIVLAAGDYFQDVVSRRNGTVDAPITITGAGAVVRGGGNPRIIEINHDHITLQGFTIDGLWGDPNSKSGYRDKLLYVIGKAPRDGVSGLRVLNMTFRNAGGECMRMRYFAQHNEVAWSSFQNCGVYDFRFADGGKNGEGVYIGTAPEQRGDGKNPTSDPDLSNDNWIHRNTFNTQGNECVEIKESASGNIVEGNVCTGQRDPKAGGFAVRGNNNVFRYNESYGNIGAGIRLGGDADSDGINNAIYGNNFHGNQAGGIKLQRGPQVQVCGNTVVNNGARSVIGKHRKGIDPARPC